jgi:hypothetical protein
MHKNTTKCNETLSKWCKNKHNASKIMDTLETYHWFSSKVLFQKSSNGVGKEKKLYAKKVVQKGACVDCGLGFCMSCLMSF